MVQNGRVVSCGPNVDLPPDTVTLRETIVPGFVDLRVFTGEPGSEHRETIRSAGEAAVAGGVTSFVTMPDTDPVMDDAALVEFVRRTGETDSPARVLPCRRPHARARGASRWPRCG